MLCIAFWSPNIYVHGLLGYFCLYLSAFWLSLFFIKLDSCAHWPPPMSSPLCRLLRLSLTTTALDCLSVNLSLTCAVALWLTVSVGKSVHSSSVTVDTINTNKNTMICTSAQHKLCSMFNSTISYSSMITFGTHLYGFHMTNINDFADILTQPLITPWG